MNSAITYNPKGSFPPTLNAQRFHPTQNIPTSVNGFYNPKYRLIDEALVRPVLSPNQRRKDTNDAQISFKVRECSSGDSFRNRFQSRHGYAEEFMRKDTVMNNNYDPEKSVEYVNKFRASTAKSSSKKSAREKRYSADGSLSEASLLPLMKQSFSFNSEYTDPVETKDASTETISGLMKKKFDSMKDINEWEKEKVDPFLFKLKKAIMHIKPEFLEEFIIGFCSREVMDQPHPDLPKSMQSQRNQNSILKPSRSTLQKRSTLHNQTQTSDNGAGSNTNSGNNNDNNNNKNNNNNDTIIENRTRESELGSDQNE